MSGIKKVVKIISSLSAAVIILFICAKIIFGVKLKADFNKITVNPEYDVKIEKQEAEVTSLSKDSKEDFKILAFTDMHFDGMHKKEMDKTMEEFLKAMNEERPDLVIFTGDIITAIFNKERAETLADVMEAYGVYWCPVLGNHEGEHPLSISRKNLISLWSDNIKYPHCLAESGPEDMNGYGNYVVNLLNSDHNISQSLIFMDSGNYVTEEDVRKLKVSKQSYAYLKADQIEWYKEKIKALPQGTKSSLFLHIPLCEYADAWNKVYDESTGSIKDTDSCRYIYGMQREAVCCSEFNSGLFDIMESLDSTKAVYCGHDHVNDYTVSYNGIELNYLQPSGYSVYGWDDEAGTKTMKFEKQSLQGYTILNIKSDGEHQITRVKYIK